jgi:hypothetical protein
MIRARPVNRETSPMSSVIRLGATLLLIAGSALAFGLLGLAGTARADDGCPLTDPSCMVATADQAPQDVQGTVGDTVVAGKDQVQQAASEVQGTANKTLNDVLGPSGGGPGGGADGGGGGGSGGGGSGSEDGRRTGDSRIRGAGPGIARTIGIPAGSPGEATTQHATTDLPGGRADDARTGGIVRALGETAVRVAIPLLLLLGLIVTFTAVQDRLDRRDPKLKLAPLGPDIVRFE